ncbi:MAG TPA: hypothetical protein VFB96_23250 [Pirellulaceae bacterium]|nr:hypothetical protein [Pirellulaceae bacterium]
MFKFTIRELLLLTLVVGMGLGWAIRERQLQAEMQRENNKYVQTLSERCLWKYRATRLRELASKEGWQVTWNNGGEVVAVSSDEESRIGR